MNCIKDRIRWKQIVSVLILLLTAGLYAAESVPAPSPVKNPADVQLAGDWQVQVAYQEKTEKFEIDPPEIITVTDEKYDSIAVFNPAGPSWRRGTVLKGLFAQECSVENAVIPGTIQVRLEPGGEPLAEGTDYIIDEANANFGRTETGKIGADTQVYVSYQYVPMRIDTVIWSKEAKMELLRGTPHAANPVPPELPAGAVRVANIYIPGRIEKLSDDDLFPILDDGALHIPEEAAAKTLLPKTWEKLHNGEPVTILAWGDSVTAGGFVPEDQKWQVQFVERLRKRFPNADIRLISEGWGGRCTNDFFAQPPGAEHNYQEKVLDPHPDLVISEFVNDSGISQGGLEKNYTRIRDDLEKIGAEWIILTPHYIRPSWMGLNTQKGIDDDPRPFTAFIRKFASENNIAVADDAVLYGRLWRRGIPHQTLMVNNINHPNAFGLSLFADALMALFGKE